MEEKPTPYDQDRHGPSTKGYTIKDLVREPYRINYLYHITHVDNLLSILNSGLLSHRRAHGGSLVIEDIADQEVINIRKWKKVPVSGKRIVDYVPMFFTPRTPMLFQRRDMQDHIAILCIDSNLLLRPGVIFTDGNAASKETNFYDTLQSLDSLDWKCIRADYWTEFEHGKRKRSAEVLVPNSIPFDYVQRIVLRTNDVEKSLHSKLRSKTEIKPRWYFDD